MFLHAEEHQVSQESSNHWFSISVIVKKLQILQLPFLTIKQHVHLLELCFVQIFPVSSIDLMYVYNTTDHSLYLLGVATHMTNTYACIQSAREKASRRASNLSAVIFYTIPAKLQNPNGKGVQLLPGQYVGDQCKTCPTIPHSHSKIHPQELTFWLQLHQKTTIVVF